MIVFPVLPGWNTLATVESAVAATLAGWAGLNVGYCGEREDCPECGCMTTAVQ